MYVNETFLQVIVWGALLLATVSPLVLLTLLIKDIKSDSLW